MMEKGNTPVLGSGRIHDFSETKSDVTDKIERPFILIGRS